MAPQREQRILTDDEIVNIILKYIDEDIYNYAIMIDGEWGCGKTYFVKESLISKIEEYEKQKVEYDKDYKARQVIYISLYGVKSTDEISKQIFTKSYLSKAENATGIAKTGIRVMGTMLPLVYDAINNKLGTSLDTDNVSDSLEKILPEKEKILIFDDLERCDCPINEILGYINSFVEQDGLKVILVANQKEIGRSTYRANQELKYLVAAHPNIVFNKKENENKVLQAYISQIGQDKQNQETVDQVDINEIQNRINRLFGQNTSYEQIKEKLVGQTIYYRADLHKILEKLVKNSNLEESLRNKLLDNITFFKSYMTNKKHLNLRTFQFFLSKIKDLYSIINQLNGKGQQVFLDYIIKYCFKICVSYKSGTYKYDWSNNEEYGRKKIGEIDVFGASLNFRFVDDYIVYSILDNGKADKMLKVYEEMYHEHSEIEAEALDLILYDWIVSSDQELEKAIETVIQGLKDNKYQMESYSIIIGALLTLEHVEFSTAYLQETINLMKDNINRLTYYVLIDNGYVIGTHMIEDKRHKEILKKLQEYVDEHMRIQLANQIQQHILMEDDWAVKLVDYINVKQFEIINIIGFLSRVNIGKLADKLKKSNSRDINAFRMCINYLYKENSIGPALEQEGKMLSELLERVKKFDYSSYDRIKRLQINYLIENLESAIEHYSNRPEFIGKVES